jgi:hypothetical protein
MTSSRSRPWRAFFASVILLGVASAASAGLPLLCHPLDAGNAPLLPFGKDAGGRTIDPTYDTRRLPQDMQQLLSPTAPLPARMENLRRAAHYVHRSPALAARLLEPLLARAAGDGPANRLAWFDAAYLVETYRQMSLSERIDLLARVDRPATRFAELNALDGYAMLGTLRTREGETAEIEFARGLMMRNGTTDMHLRRARDLAPTDPMLVANLAKFIGR